MDSITTYLSAHNIEQSSPLSFQLIGGFKWQFVSNENHTYALCWQDGQHNDIKFAYYFESGATIEQVMQHESFTNSTPI